jgi:DNA modification methylase
VHVAETRNEWRALQSIAGAVRNPKDHDLSELVTSIRRFGFVGSVIVDERTQRLVSGHGRVDALRAMAKAKEAIPVGLKASATGDWLVPVELWRSGSDLEAEAFVVAANRIGERGGWNEATLEAVLGDLARSGAKALEGIGYDLEDVERMLGDLEREAQAGAASEPEAPGDATPATLYVESGDLWQLGDHWLLVGDSTRGEDVARLFAAAGVEKADAVVTDPPYAIYGSSTGIGADIADDKMVRPFFESVGRLLAANVRTFGHAYVFTDWRSWPALVDGFRRCGSLAPKNALVWDKGGGGLGSMWAQCYELIGFFVVQPPARAMSSNEARGQRTVYRPNILRYSRPVGDEREHNAAKPVELLVELLEASSDVGAVILEPFTGSGSTMVAAQRVGRRVLGLEIEPRFAQVAIERWQRVTGQKATKHGGAL